MMVLVPAGCFMMGSENLDSDEKPVHQQCLGAPFWIDKYEVSRSQFETLGGTRALENTFRGDIRPVENITWFEAQDFCEQQRNGRLPTEVEWEYTARGVDGLDYPWGNEFNRNYVAASWNSFGETRVINSFPLGKSWVGAHDMSGNVWEWTSSLALPYPYSAMTHEDDSDRLTARIVRGGSFYSTSATVLESANRNGIYPDRYSRLRGFRCVRDF